MKQIKDKRYIISILSIFILLSVYNYNLSTVEAESKNLRNSFTIMKGTDSATQVYVINSGKVGPTVMVTGGMHGDEISGWKAAGMVKDWQVDAGKLVVIPQLNKTAVKRRFRYGADGLDLNRQFPIGTENNPKTELARAIWQVVLKYEPAVLIDLHSSRGIHGVTGGVGQTLVTHYTQDAKEFGDMAMEYMNKYHLSPQKKPDHLFHRLGMELPMLAYKAGSDLNIPTFIAEAARPGNDLKTRIRWQLGYVEQLLKWYGLVNQERIIVPRAYNSQWTLKFDNIRPLIVGGRREELMVSALKDNKKINLTRLTKFLSSNKEVALIDSKGKLTPVGPGITTIKAVYGQLEEKYIVRVFPTHLIESQTIQLFPELFAREKLTEVVYRSDNSKVLEVDNTGLVTAIKPGDASIILEDKKTDKKYTIEMHILPLVDRLSLNIDKSSYSRNDFKGKYPIVPAKTGTISIEYDLTLLDAKFYGGIGLLDSSTTATWWTDMPLILRVYSEGYFDVRNGEDYEANKIINYQLGKRYHVRVVTDLSEKKYSVYITPEDGQETLIAEDYKFRIGAPIPENIGQYYLKSERDDQFRVENLKISKVMGQNSNNSIYKMKVNQRQQLVVEGIYFHHPDLNLTFSDNINYESTNPEVVTVDEKGVVKAVQRGEAQIKVTLKLHKFEMVRFLDIRVEEDKVVTQ